MIILWFSGSGDQVSGIELFGANSGQQNQQHDR
jgi:hypothetical protein